MTIVARATSVPSNEIRVFVNTPSPPSPPTSLLGLVSDCGPSVGAFDIAAAVP